MQMIFKMALVGSIISTSFAHDSHISKVKTDFTTECNSDCSEPCAEESTVLNTLESDDNDQKVNPIISNNEVTRGARDGDINIVVYSDFECSYCAKSFKETIAPLLVDSHYKVKYTYKHMPLQDIHPHAQDAALYYEALRLQSPELATNFHDYILTHQERLLSEGESFLKESVDKVHGDIEQVALDISKPKLLAIVKEHQKEAKDFGVKGTPSYIINGTKVIGHRSLEEMKRIIEKS